MRYLVPLVTVLGALALLPAAAFAHGGSEVSIAGHPHANGPIEIKGNGFGPGEVVALELRRQGQAPVPLGSATADQEGMFALALHVPAGTPAAIYQLVATSGAETTSAEAAVYEPIDGAAPAEGPSLENIDNDRPGGETAGLAIVTALVALLGGAIIVGERRQAVRRLQEQ